MKLWAQMVYAYAHICMYAYMQAPADTHVGTYIKKTILHYTKIYMRNRINETTPQMSYKPH